MHLRKKSVKPRVSVTGREPM